MWASEVIGVTFKLSECAFDGWWQRLC